MAKREAYARATVELNGVECSPGVESREGDDVEEMTHNVQRFARIALRTWGGNHEGVVRVVEKLIKRRYPDRAYFIETEEEGRGVQVFQPYGLPREAEGE